jgi:hypothetical protein
MSQTTISTKQQRYDTAARVDMQLEVALIPVSDVDRAKGFCPRLGWRLDDIVMGNDFRALQFTPTGSRCSVSFGKGVTATAPGSLRGGLIVSDIEAAHKKHNGHRDANWPDWYAAYLAAEQAGAELPM